MSNIKEVKIKCPCCDKDLLIQVNKDTGEISGVLFYINHENQHQVDEILKKHGIEFG